MGLHGLLQGSLYLFSSFIYVYTGDFKSKVALADFIQVFKICILKLIRKTETGIPLPLGIFFHYHSVLCPKDECSAGRT
jgi:hypothetical protein